MRNCKLKNLIYTIALSITITTISCGNETDFIKISEELNKSPDNRTSEYERSNAIKTNKNSETFRQIYINKKLDLIWIVDNSGSMHNVQETLLRNYKNFIEIFLKNKIDVKMAITTTDTSGRGSVFNHDGQFVGELPILSSLLSNDEFEDAFLKNIMVGTFGSGRERGLEAMFMALEKNFDSSTVNYNFIRDDAFLAIVIVSDENDVSPKSTMSYVDFLKNIKPNINQYAIYSIVDTINESYPDPYYQGIDLNLYYSHKWNNPGGLRYINASNNTGGQYYEITEDFYESLLDIGLSITGLINSFQLEFAPLIDSIVVMVESTVIPRTAKGSQYGWFYDQKNLSIVFNEKSVPSQNNIITIEYNY